MLKICKILFWHRNLQKNILNIQNMLSPPKYFSDLCQTVNKAKIPSKLFSELYVQIITIKVKPNQSTYLSASFLLCQTDKSTFKKTEFFSQLVDIPQYLDRFICIASVGQVQYYYYRKSYKIIKYRINPNPFLPKYSIPTLLISFLSQIINK